MSSKEVNERVKQLEYAIWHICNLIKQLNTNACNSKVQIQADFNQIVECFRGMEASLLSQVDQILRTKVETVHHQQARLSQALGVLQLILNGAVSEGQLNDIMEKLRDLELMPKESPNISLRSGPPSLLESIINYGHVDGNGVPLATNLSPAKCHGLYDQDPNGLLNSMGSEIKEAQKSISSSSFVPPLLSNKIEDWLQKQSSNTKTEDNNAPLKMLSTTFPKISAFSSHTDSRNLPINCTFDSSCDISKWLSKQSVSPNEHQTFDVSNNHTATIEEMSLGESEQNHVDSIDQVGADLKKWLSDGSTSSLPSTFNAVPDGYKTWLLQASQQLTSLDDLKHKNHFQHVSKEPRSWLSLQAYRKQETCHQKCDGTSFFSHMNKDKEFWLQKQTEKNTNRQNEHKVCSTAVGSRDTKTKCCRKILAMEVDEKWLSSSKSSTPLYQIEDICRANELCNSLSECVSQPDCCTIWFREKSPVKNVVDPTQAFKPLSPEFYKWLSPVSQNYNQQLANDITNDMFQHIQAVKSSSWLMNSATTKSLPSKFKDDKEESNLWQQKASTSVPESNSSVETIKSSPTTSPVTVFDWLMVSDEDYEKHQEMHDEDKVSEGWSICSDCNSACTEQCVNDIEAAKDYFSKWLS